MNTSEHIDETLVGPEVGGRTSELPSVAIRQRREERPATLEELKAFDAAVAKWYGTGKERMRELGFETTDEFMKAILPDP